MSTKIWNDDKFRAFTDDGQLAFLMLMTHPHMTAVGAMRGTIQGLAAEKKWNEKRFRDALAPALEHGMVRVDETVSLIWLPNFIFHNLPESPNVILSWPAVMETLPECRLRDEIPRRLWDGIQSLSKAFREAFREGFGKGWGNQEQEQEQEQEQKSTPAIALKSPGPKTKAKELVGEVIAYLNAVTGSKYKPTDAYARLIHGRMAEGHGIADFKRVVDVMAAEWMGDAKMEPYLRPDTLFRPTKFQGYLNRKPKPPKPGEPGFQPGPADKVVLAYRVAIGIPENGKKAWNAENWDETKTHAEALLKFFDGDEKQAVACVEGLVAKFKKAGHGFTFKTIRAHAAEFKHGVGV